MTQLSWTASTAEARKLNEGKQHPDAQHLLSAGPLYARVPKDLSENLEHRRRWLQIGASSPQAARTVWQFCKLDPLWYWNTFCWTYDPRTDAKAVPFITYAYQDDVLMDAIHAIRTGEDRLVEKSRDMGASWITLYAFEYLWHFFPLNSFRVISRKEELVDSPGDSDSLFWKLDFILKYLPAWLRPPITRTSLHLGNEANGSSIDGESTTGDSGRGGRSTADLYDEFASVENGKAILASSADRTRCRFFVSTPKGQANAFYELRERQGITIVRLHWSMHPVKARGLYTSKDGKLRVISGTPIPGYPYILDGKLRSPWYDKECTRRSAMEVAQELDIDYLGSDYIFFDTAALDRINSELCMPPLRRGELRYDPQSIRVYPASPFSDLPDGRLLLWSQLDTTLRLPDRQWAIACDIAMGTGASNSAMHIGCREIPEIVGELADPRTTPQDWADMAMAMADWLRAGTDHWPLIIFEANGPGRLFADRLLKRDYPNIYWRTKDGRPNSKQTEMAGWYSTPETKLSLLGEFRRALITGSLTIRSKLLVNELRQYVFRQGGVVEHASQGKSDDPSGAKDNHGDRGISAALLWHAIGKESAPPIVGDKPIEPGTFAFRQQQRRNKRTQETLW